MTEFFVFFGFVLLVVACVVLGVWLFKARCPVCGKLFAGRVVGSSKIASFTSVETVRDPQTGKSEEVAIRQTGYLIARRCRYCEHRWERIETRNQRLSNVNPAELEELRRRQR